MAGAGPQTVPAKPYCSRGHAYTTDNTIWRANGKYVCRKCKRIRAEAYERRVRLNRLRKKLESARPAIPVVRQLFLLAKNDRVTLQALAYRSGYSEKSMSFWRSGRTRMYAAALIDLYGALGYDLVPVKRGE